MPVVVPIVAAVAGAGASALFSGGGGGETQSTTTQTDPYKQAMMDVFLPYYKQLAPATSNAILAKMSGTALPEDLAATIGKYYGQAGEKYGNYFASNNMLQSGPAQLAFQGLTQEEIATKLSTLLGQQREGMNQALSFMGMQPSGASGTSTTTTQEPMDWTGIGELLSKANFGSPSTIPLGATSYGGGSWGSSTPYNPYVNVGGLGNVLTAPVGYSGY
jgi:hypothetical protein